jgi:hypothetical protein
LTYTSSSKTSRALPQVYFLVVGLPEYAYRFHFCCSVADD